MKTERVAGKENIDSNLLPENAQVRERMEY
jgi:hypothetical protein